MLTVRQHMALQVEAVRWKYQGVKATWIRENLGWSLTRHAQVVNALLDDPMALAEYPQLVMRLRRLRETRRAARRARVPA